MGDDKSIPKAARITQKAPDLTRIESAEDVRKAISDVNKTMSEASQGTVVDGPALGNSALGNPALGNPTLGKVEAPKKPAPTKPTPANDYGTRIETANDVRKSSAPPNATVFENPAVRPAPAMPTSIEANAGRPVMPHEATRVESVEEIRKIVAEARANQGFVPVVPTNQAPANAIPASLPAAALAAAGPYRPLRRPPVAVLTICDDFGSGGETARLRNDRTVVGRDQGDVRVPHDAQMSSSHCEIVREPMETTWRWVVADLQSANGTFVRMGSVPLKHGLEVIIGSTRLRFDDAALNLPGAIQDTGPAIPVKTLGWQAFAPTDLKASIVVLHPDGPEKRHFLDASEQWIGRDPACPIHLPDDSLADPRHARVVRDPKGNWSLIDGKSRNGLWVRIGKHAIDSDCEFQLGEQRFLLRTSG